jgi:uncharacterized protein (TIGR03437 family)
MKTILILLCMFASTVQAAGTIYSALLSGDGEDYASAVASDAQGNVYVVGLTYSPHFPVTPGAYQTTIGQTCDAFVAKVGPDGKVIWSTYLGGILDDWATGVALDSAGNVLVTGWTRSPDFPLVNPIQSVYTGFAAFVAKFDPTGSKLLYSTFLGGQGQTGAAGIAVDSAGNAYIAASTLNATGYPGTQTWPDQPGIFVTKLTPQGTLGYSYFHSGGTAAGIALDSTGAVYVAGFYSSFLPSAATKSFGTPGTGSAIVFKISPDGSKKLYETALGGSVQAGANAVAVNSAGEVFVAGSTSSVDFPLVNPLQSTLGARPLWKSTDSGATWVPIDNLPFALPQMLVVDPTAPATLYQATGDLGTFKSVDAGATWAAASSGIAATNIAALAIDPVHPQILYAATASAVYKSTDGAKTWSVADFSPIPTSKILIDAQNPNIVYEVGGNIRKSTNAGATWAAVTFPGGTVQSMVLDPHVSGTVIAVNNEVLLGPHGGPGGTFSYIWRSLDGGATWTQGQLVQPTGIGLLVDGSTNPSTVYDNFQLLSVDGGATWSPIVPPAIGADTSAIAVDPSGTLYAALYGAGIYTSRDRAKTWSAIASPSSSPPVVGLVAAGSAGTLYSTIQQTATSGFVSKLSADGSTLEYSTYLRGHATSGPISTVVAEPVAFLTQSWISGLVLDAAGNMVVAGGTRATDLPTVNPAQAANAGRADAFAAILSADGSKLNYSTYFGGSLDDAALAVALDSLGNVIVAGQTWSGDFPVADGSKAPYTYGDGFLVKLATGPPVISSVLNGAGFQPGIEAGSWVSIKGSNLSNTTRTWAGSDFVNGNLPVSLDGVSVTIDGKPAFVEYVSPTQINVQAPSDSAVGSVNVVVTNNGAVSGPGTAQLQTAAPAFFTYLGSAIASRLPDYALVGDPSAIAVAVGAKAGDLVVLWGTGFGATTPPVAAGTVVSGAPAVVANPTVSVGGLPAQVLSTLLTAGSAGLYQVTIRVPDLTPTGAVPVQAFVGGAQTPSGVTLYIGRP